MEKFVRLVLENKSKQDERVLYLKPLNENDDYVLTETLNDNEEALHVLVDEGYVKTHYWYVLSQWNIKELSVMIED